MNIKEFFMAKRFGGGSGGSGGGGSCDDVRYVTFMSYDGMVKYGKKPVAVGDDCADPIARGIFDTPTRESDPQYNYTFYGWATTPGGAADSNWNKAITENKTVYANFASSVRYYAVRFYNENTLLQTVNVRYEEDATYTGETPTKSGYTFIGWNPEPKNITENIDCYAQFESANVDPGATDFSQGYGVEWDYTQSATTLARTGLASGFSDPVPATSLTAAGSSPFDNVMPWAGMKKYNIIDGAVAYSEDDAGFSMTDYDTVVYIPEFYYAANKDEANSKWRWSISPTPKEGYDLHPGSGRYIGRYHTSGEYNSDGPVFSKSGVNPLVNTDLLKFRTRSHSKDDKWWMLDIATWSAIQLLYLVEFADFNSQKKLGSGAESQNLGSTDTAVYHTYNGGNTTNQYRWVEQPFGCVLDFVDGFLSYNLACYIGTNNSEFSGSKSDYEDAGVSLPDANGYITGFGYSNKFPWAMLPDSAQGGSGSTYVPDYVNVRANYGSELALYVGGYNATGSGRGLFYFVSDKDQGDVGMTIGSRLIYIP